MDALVMERISSLLAYRRWFRANRWAEWTTLRTEYDVELRALLRLARQARALAAKPVAETWPDHYAGMPR